MNILLASAAILVGFVQPSGEVRTWTDQTGRHQVEARFLDFRGDHVRLERADGQAFNLPIQQLSKADQDYVREQARLAAVAAVAAEAAAPAAEPGPIRYGPGRKLCDLANQAIDESSGLACSHRQEGVLWTHNDSGDAARLYAFDLQGHDLGSCVLKDVIAYDWEDMASFVYQGKPYLLVGDTGNNGLSAEVHILYVIEEPAIAPDRGLTVDSVSVARTIYLAFEGDAYRDCEALAVDPTDRTILLVTKERDGPCSAFALAWPANDAKRVWIAKRIGELKIPRATAMDVSPDGRRAVVLTYGNAYEYTRKEGEGWAKAFVRPPREIRIPKRIQGESICYASDGKTLYLTSEDLPTPLIEVPVAP